MKVFSPSILKETLRKGLQTILRLKQRKTLLRNIVILALAIFVVLVLALPLFAGTHSYPLTVVDGTSMLPTLENGDLVYYTGISKNTLVLKGTIIVFTQEQSGPLSFLIRPVVIHRVVDYVTLADGSIGYVTEGDNNGYRDGGYVLPQNVLGEVATVIPKVGLVFQFIKSAQGLAVLISVIVIVYLVAYDTRWSRDKRKEIFLGNMAQKTINGEFPDELFKKFELILKYGDSMNPALIRDPEAHAIAQWLKKGAIDHDWKIETVDCSKCGAPAVRLSSQKGRSLELCSKCFSKSQSNDE
jgi:signal peptidase